MNRVAKLVLCGIAMGGGMIGAPAKGADDKYAAGSSYRGEPVPMPIPPWPGQYKLTAADRSKLTPADVVGPDGVVYPNWRSVGVEGGIPDVPVVLKLADLGARPGTDISDLIAKACETVGAKGGGAVLIGSGVYYLDHPVIIRQSGVVVRGSGRDATRLVFRYSLVDPNARPRGYPEPAAFLLQGADLEALERPLAADGKRGDTALTLKDIADLNVGDRFVLRAPTTPRWQAITKDQSPPQWGSRVGYYAIRSIAGNTIDIGQPLRIDFPLADGSNLRRMRPIERSGLEDLTLEHTCKLAFHSVNSQWAWNCWVRRVKVLNSGRSGVHFQAAKQCEVRDCEFDSCWNHGGGGVGYGGFTQSADCLMENCLWINYRHAPCVQYGAQGNVIRNCTMEGSDAQWHAGWAAENLFENCILLPARTQHSDGTPRYTAASYGTYGFGMFSTASHDTTHGPNGPRNVVYNCDVSCERDGVYGRGASENWIFLHNRFVLRYPGAGGFYAESGFFDTIIRNNVFVLQDPARPMLFLRTPDCVGIELIDNTVYGGNGKIVEGATTVAVDRGNRALPAVAPGAPMPARPKAEPASIYQWQQSARTR